MKKDRDKKQIESSVITSTQEFLRFVSIIIHDLGHSVGRIRIIAHSFKQEKNLPPIILANLNKLIDESDFLAYGIRVIRLLGYPGEPEICDFAVDILQPAVSLLGDRFPRVRLIINSSARKYSHVNLKRGLAVISLIKIIKYLKPKSINCNAVISGLNVVYTLGFSGTSKNTAPYLDSLCEKLLSESGVLSSKINISKERTHLELMLEMGKSQ